MNLPDVEAITSHHSFFDFLRTGRPILRNSSPFGESRIRLTGLGSSSTLGLESGICNGPGNSPKRKTKFPEAVEKNSVCKYAIQDRSARSSPVLRSQNKPTRRHPDQIFLSVFQSACISSLTSKIAATASLENA